MSSFDLVRRPLPTRSVQGGSLPMSASIYLTLGVEGWMVGPLTGLKKVWPRGYQNTRVPEAEWHEGSYTAAEALVRPLMEDLSSAVKRIRRERRIRIGEFTPEVLRDYCPGFQMETLQRLCQPFQ